MKLADKIIEDILSFNKLWAKVYPMFQVPMIHLKKIAKFDTKDIDDKTRKQIQSKVELIDKELKELDKLIDDAMFKE